VGDAICYRVATMARYDHPLPQARCGGGPFQPGTRVDIPTGDASLKFTSIGRSAEILDVDGMFLADSETVVTDDDVLEVLDAGRR